MMKQEINWTEFTSYADILSKHVTGSGKTDMVQMPLKPKINIKPMDQTPYI